MLADSIEDDVVGLAILREVFLRVVDDPICSERSHEFEVLAATYRGDVGAEVPGQLYPPRFRWPQTLHRSGFSFPRGDQPVSGTTTRLALRRKSRRPPRSSFLAVCAQSWRSLVCR